MLTSQLTFLAIQEQQAKFGCESRTDHSRQEPQRMEIFISASLGEVFFNSSTSGLHVLIQNRLLIIAERQVLE